MQVAPASTSGVSIEEKTQRRYVTHEMVHLLACSQLLCRVCDIPLPACNVHVNRIHVDNVVTSKCMRFATVDFDLFAALEAFACMEPSQRLVPGKDGGQERIARYMRVHAMLIAINVYLECGVRQGQDVGT